MKILGIETSCDETAAAVVEDGKNILSSVVSSQFHIHERFGGIVPELASRDHIRQIIPIVEKALSDAKTDLQSIDAIAVTKGPGLIGSLMVGVNVAKSLSYASNKPLIGVHHIEGHICAAFLGDPMIQFPFISLVASGGHTHMFYVIELGKYEIIGKTIDDAAGEAFDKVAKLLGLPFPGGPSIDKLSKTGNPSAIDFPRPFLQGLDFSFSGLKTSVSVWLQNNKDKFSKEDIAASFQEAIVDTLIHKLKKAVEEKEVEQLVISGGVAANSRLREKLPKSMHPNLRIALTPLSYCTDNAAMIATAAYFQHKKNPKFDSIELTPRAIIPLTEANT